MRFIITLQILFLMSGTLLQTLHPLYHSHEHHSSQTIHVNQVQEKDNCLIDAYTFYQRISHEPVSVTFDPVEYETGGVIAIDKPSAYSVFITYLLRAPPLRA